MTKRSRTLLSRTLTLLVTITLLPSLAFAQGGTSDNTGVIYENALGLLQSASLIDKDRLESVRELLNQAGVYKYSAEYGMFVDVLLILARDETEHFDDAADSLRRLQRHQLFIKDYVGKSVFPDLEGVAAYIKARKLEANDDQAEAIALYEAQPVLDALPRATSLASALRKEQYEQALSLLKEDTLPSVTKAIQLLETLGEYRDSLRYLDIAKHKIAKLVTPKPTVTALPMQIPTREPLRQLDCDCVTGNDRQKKDGMIKVKWIFYALGLEQDVEDDFGLTPQAWELIENVQRVNGRAPSDRLSDEDYTELFNRAMSQHQLDMFVLGHERSDEQVQTMFHVAGPGKVTAEGLRDTLEVRRMAQMKLYTLSGYYQHIMGEAPESLKDARDVVRCMRQMAVELWKDLHVLGYVEREMPALLVQRDGVPGSALDEALAAFYKDHGAGDGMPYQANDTGFYQVGIDFTLVNELASGQHAMKVKDK